MSARDATGAAPLTAEPSAVPVPAENAAGGFVVRAPGRVNLIGEHTDYNDGFVLPMAIERELRLTVRRRGDRLGVLRSDRDPAIATIALDQPLAPGDRSWTAYPAGVIAGFQARDWELPGFEADVSGNLPPGGGLSSSAALAVAMATAVEALCGRTLPPEEKALLCQQAEHDFAGVPCGIMDQFAVTFGRAGHALLLDCRSRRMRHVPLADERVRILVVDSGVRHSLANGAYAARREECAAAAHRLGARALRDVTRDAWRRQSAGLPDRERRRAAHVLSEIDRTLRFVAAAEGGDWGQAGRLMLQSHASLATDFEVSCPEVDTLVAVAAGLPGVYGCRMTGAGFGGCVVALVAADHAESVMNALARDYRAATGIRTGMFVTRATDGAGITAS
jgi:galactokinase